jgi:hypothetical protein
MLKHTPGPWQRVVARNTSAAYTRIGAGDYGAVADCGGCRPSQEENAANARLIAAAPDLLAALRAFVEQATKVSGFPQTYEPYVGALVAARTAIAKAENGQ